MTDFTTERRALLQAARDEFEAGEAERARVDRALALRLGVALGAVAGAATSASASTAPAAIAGAGAGKVGAGAAAATSLVVPAAKWFGAALLVGAVAAGGVSAVRMSHGAQPGVGLGLAVPSAARGPEAKPEAPAPPLLPPSTTQALDPSGPERANPRAAPPRSFVVPSGRPSATVATEARLLRRADEALRDGDAARALLLLREHERTYPSGVLAEERSAELVSTLCSLGRVAEAREEADKFLRTTPESPLAATVRRSCGGR
jgi:hypothetical protein